MAKVRKLKRWLDGEWTWEITEHPRCVYYTNRHGEGIFVQDQENGESRQLTGTAQFSACDTVEGMRKKLNKMICANEIYGL